MKSGREPKHGIWKRAREWMRARGTRRRFEEMLAEASERPRPGPLEVVIVADHLRAWRNAGAIARSAGVFGANSMIVVGTKYFDPGPAMGALHHVPLRFFDTFREAAAALARDGYTLYALEPPRVGHVTRHLHETRLPKKTAFVVGHETRGLSFRIEDYPDVVPLSIAQYGAVPCLNVSVAAGLALYEYATQHQGREAAARRSGDP